MADRERSFWGWGYADRFPAEETRRALADRLEAELGFPERPLLDPPSLAEVDVPPSAVGPDGAVTVPDGLADVCSTDREARVRHTYGRAYHDLVRGFRGDFEAAPDVVARPTDEADVAAVLAWAGEHRLAVVPYGGGTSVVGGVEVAVGDGYAGVVSLDLRGMDRVLEVDRTSRSALVQAGATGPELNEGLAEDGLQLRHYPQSYEFSTVGGWIATRSGGHFATRYTRIDDFVESVRAITPAGTLETRRVPSSGAGPDPNRFLLGSEGAFGVLTRAWLRVQPRPSHRSRASVRFDDWDAAVAATREVVQARLSPANCRLLDPTEAMLNEVATDGSSVLVLGFESIDGPTDRPLQRALAICRDRGGTVSEGPVHRGPDGRGAADDGQAGDADGSEDIGAADGDEDADAADGSEDADAADWREAFVEGPYLFNQLVSVGVLVDTFETAVTWDRFPDLHDAVRSRVGAALTEACGTGVVACRFTHVYPDGPAPYYTVLGPAEPGRELEQWRAVKAAASEALHEHGGTITHHHAVGRTHREWYDREAPELYRKALGSMKRTLDPEGIMNPGVLVDASTDGS